MPSTYTVNLGIEKPATGEQSGTWGDTTNTNFDILDQGINGAVRVTLSSAGSSGSPNALIITNGAASDGRNKWIEFYSSGDLGGDVFVQLQPNDAEKIVFIRNSLAGSRSVLLFQGTYNSGRDLEISAGVDMVVKFDGGGASAANVTDVYNNLKVTGLVAGTADINGGTVDGTVIGGASAAALTATTVVANTSLNIAGDGATVTGIKDEDNMASNSATKLATQQSIKAYVDSQVGTVDTLAEILANGNTTGANDIDVDAAQKVQFRDAAIYINSSVDGQLDIVADTEIQIAATTIDINGAIVASGEISAASLDISGDVDIDGTLNVDAIDIDGAVQLDNTLTVGVDDTGYDVKFYGATGGAYMLWDESADDLILAGAGGLVVAGNVDFNGDLDVDGTTNLDVVDIDGAVDMASTLAVAGAVTASSTLTAQKLVSTNGVLELDDNGSHNGVINSPASLFINIDSDGTNTGEDFVISKDRTGTSGGTELFRVQEDGFVGIGGSPVEKLYVNSTSGDARIGLNAPTGSDTEIKFFNNGSVNYTIGHDDATDNFVIGTANVDTPLLSVTKAGDVLVGKSALAFATAGTEIMDHGEIQVTRASGVPMYLRRNSSDGDILVFYKDGTDVGSIGNNGDNLGIESVDVGLLFLSGSSQIVPTGGNFGVSDGTKDLGRSNTRFKDIHLSGGVQNITASGVATDTLISAIAGVTNGFQISANTSNEMTYDFNTGAGLKMSLTNDGKLGIGTSVPDSPLEIQAATNSSSDTTYLKLYNAGENVGNIDFENGNGSLARITGTKAGTGASANDGILTFSTAFDASLAEAMRILADGSVAQGNSVSLVASNYSNQAGAAWHEPDGHYEIATTSNVAPLQIGKNNANDGSLVVFRKQSTVVGGITSRSGATLGLILNVTSGSGAGLSGTSNGIFPIDETTTPVNDQISLGTTSNAFKDLYLSGGVYLGGTGAANKLDDYETGTWTPAYTPTTGTFTTITTVSTGRYTKVGRLVTVFATMRTSGTLDVTGASGNLKITGLPFACNATLGAGGADLGHQSWNLGTDILNTRMSVAAGANEILMFKNTMNGSSFPSGNITVAEMSTSGGSFSNLISFTASYEV